MNSYQSLEATLHDVFWASEGPSLEWPLLRDFLQKHPGRSLEIGCGSGRLLLPLLDEGFTVDGLELSPEMLDLCHQQSAHSGLMLYQGSMDDWKAPQPYASVMVPAFTLQLSRDPVAALQHFATLLDNQGALYLSTFTPLAEILGELAENEWYPDHQTQLADGQLATIHTKHQIHREQQVLHRQHRYEIHNEQGERTAAHESSQQLHWFTREQLKKHLKSAGFIIESQIPDFKPTRKSLAQAQILSTIARKA
jgi:SAM-dependent methyltransferase